MTDKEKRENAPNDEIVPAPKPKKVAAAQEDPQDDDDEQKEEERRQRQEKVKKRKEEMRRKAEQKRKQEQEEEDEVLDEDQPPRKTKPAAKQPIRENVVNNSVMFLNHPKVKSAPMSQKIAYLQKKGLTQEEIQETIERAGESVPANTPGFSQSASSQSYNNPALPPRPSNYYGPQVPPPGYPPQPYPQQQMIPVPPPQQTWYGGKLGLAITIASCVGIGMGFSYVAKNYISPWLFSRPDKEETKQREEYQTKVFEEMLQSLKSMQQSNTELKDYMKTQGELKDLIKTALDTKNTTTTSLTQSGARDLERMKIAEMEAELKKMKAMMVDTKSLQSSTSSSYQTWNPTESKIPAWQRSVSSSAPSVNTNPTPQPVDSFKSPAKETLPVTTPTATSPNSPDPVPQSYAQILDMVRNGQLPDDIKDIDDKPREPFTPIEKGERESRPKPWQKKAAEPAPASPSIPTNAEQANGQPQTETKPATEVKPEEVVS